MISSIIQRLRQSKTTACSTLMLETIDFPRQILKRIDPEGHFLKLEARRKNMSKKQFGFSWEEYTD